MQAFRSSTFWISFFITDVILGLFFAWELKMITLPFLSAPARPAPTSGEITFAVILGLLIALNAGLFQWRKKYGTCPLGAKRATGIAGVVGATALLCPACVLIPFTLFGLSVSLTFLSPFIPLLRIIALILLVVSTVMLWPKKV